MKPNRPRIEIAISCNVSSIALVPVHWLRSLRAPKVPHVPVFNSTTNVYPLLFIETSNILQLVQVYTSGYHLQPNGSRLEYLEQSVLVPGVMFD